MQRQFSQGFTQQEEQQIVRQQQQTFTQQQFTEQRRVEQHVTRQVVSSSEHRVQGTGMTSIQQIPSQPALMGRPTDISPPVFEQIFRNARFAQGGNALFEGRVRGNPKPTVSWTRKGSPLFESNKYKMQYEEQTGNVSLLINQIGPGDEGEYTCTARNQYGEAICSVYIQPEGMALPAQKETRQTSSYQRFQQTNTTNGYTNGYTVVEEDFKVDTFEYRILREVSFRESLTRRYAGESDVEISQTIDRSLGPVAPPQVGQKPRNSKLVEGSDAIFQAKISANPKPRLTWFKNGQRIVPSQKYQTMYSNQQATMKISNTTTQDSGHYTLLAENPQGCIVSSAYLAIEPSGQDAHFEQQRELFMKSSQQTETSTVIDTTDSSKTLAPTFVRVCNDRDATEGKMTRFDCRVTGRPYPEVTWYINGRPVTDDNTHKILVNESGNHALMITNVGRMDAGVVQCVARNKGGETSFQCNLNVIEKEQVVAPKFVERFTTVNVKEGEPVVLNARAVGTPIPRITWQKDGIPLTSGPDVRITVDGGATTLDIPRAKASDAAWYQCTAQNVAGSTASRARLFVEVPQGSTPEPRRLNLPRPTKVIEPEPAPGPEVIYLRHVERAKPHAPQAEQDRTYPPPQFIIPLRNVSQVEGGRIHFEARVEPVGDPTMRVEWFINGRPLAASSRATTTYRFGFIALDLISVIIEDSGEYVCRVTSATGSVESQATLSVTVRASIEQTSQHPDSLQYIQQLEDYSRYQRTESIEETSAQRPTFIRPLQELGELQEGRNAHFEGQLTPVSDPTMKVEWFKDGKPITASSRTTTIFNFGYVSLNILHLRAEDAGQYTVRAVNRLGEAISQSTLRVAAKTSVTGDLGIPEQQRYIEKVEQLEAFQQQQQYRYIQEAPESTSPPEFKTPIKDQLNIREGGFAHFEARLEPIGDSTLRVEWLKDGRPVEASSRITTFFNFGYVALTIKYVTVHDIGTYTCRAYNTLGQATTAAQMTVISKKDVIMDSQHPGGLEKIQYLEDSSRYGRTISEETTVTQKPRFLGPLKGTNKIVEGQRAHFEARVEPLNDMTMTIEWYFNGRVIQSANRIQAYHDFGYAALDIVSVRAEDAGTYTIVARNALGEAQMSATMEVETRSSIDTTSMHRMTMEKTQRIEDSKFVEPHYHIEEISKSKPIFVQPLSDPKPIYEGKNIHLECRLEPMGDPTMRVEWFCNGRSITVGSRFRTYYDFGYVALDIVHATSIDSGEYTVRATNHLGSAHTSACVRVISRSDIVTDSQNETALEQIQMLEDSSRHHRTMTEDVTVIQAPQFTRPLHNIETVEGTNIHLECRLQPVGDPSMRVEWFVNGRPCKTGHRFRPAYDFDYVALDLLSVYPVDSGVYTCQARNQLGEAVTSCSVRVIAKKDLILESQHPSGLEKIQYLEDSSRYKKSEYTDEVVNIRPKFITKPKNLEHMRESQHAHFECKLEPVTDPNLKVEWYKNGQPITVGHRFRPIHDFGYVALDIIDLIEEDSATYTCRAVNLVGADETTCILRCRSTAQILTGTQNEMGLEQIQMLEDRSRYQRSEMIEETTTQAPIFTTSLKNIEIKEGQRAHFECRLIPVSDPTMRVEWFHNNVPVKSGSRFNETNNFGFVALDILYCYPEDSGTYTCRARNALGEAVTSATLTTHSKKSIYLESQHESALSHLTTLEDSSRHQRQVVQDDTVTQAPMFTTPMRDLRVAENQAAHFEARLIPVGDPKLRVEWLRNGVPIQASNRVMTMHDFGYVAFNMKYVYPEDSGTYTCRAINELGEAVTSATMVVQSKASLLLESQHEGALEKLQMLEDSTKYQRQQEEDVVVTQAPRFTTQLNGPTNLVEGQSAHYECRIEPYPDANLKVEWFHNGQPLQTGHRFRTTYDFGFAALDILTAYGEDSGDYTCKATNRLGQASSSIKTNVKTRSSIIMETQHEGALQKIAHLEGSRHRRVEEETKVAEKPQFGRPLKNADVVEGESVHLEATLTPVNDPTMKVEWFCNGRPIPQGHRFKTTYDFGFVALDILYAYAEDSGTYMCKARNTVGEAVTTSAVQVKAKSGLYLDTLDAERLKKIRDLESYERPAKAEVEPQQQKPVFITPLTSLENLKEGAHAHLECRVEPIHDPNLKIEWFVNGVAIKTGHRFRTTHDFGYVALDVLYTYSEDSGTYMCKATNLLGEAVNTCTVKVASRRSIYLESQHPEGLAKIQELEAQGRPGRLEVEEPVPTPPRFVTQLRGTTELMEGQTAHFECQVEPLHDPNLRIEFYHNGKPLPSAARFHITFDFGYVALDIGHVVPEDAGEYSVKAINALGQCTSSINLKVTAKGSIIMESQRPEGLEKIRLLEGHAPHQRPEIPEPTRQRPVFTQPLQNIDTLAEGQTAHFECRLIPVGDPTLKVEWFRNEKPLEDSSRISKTHDFGFVALDMTHVRDEDEGVYMCRASNALGEAVTTASMKIKSKASIQLETQHPEGMRKIQQLEEGRGPARPDEPDKVFEKPIFTQLLTGPTELWEGQHAHFECRVVPVGDPSLKFEWFVNGIELKMGSRYHTTTDFGFVTLDINSVVTEDSGVYTCKAINKAGEAVSSTTFKVKSRTNIVGEPIQPDAWKKIQLKEAEMNHVPEMFVDTTPQQAPVFTTHLTSHDKLVESQHVHLEAQVEPRADPNLRVEWFKNGITLTTGTRIRSTFDFGLVTLSINGLRPDDSAIYTCKATNLLGEAVSTCTLKIEDRHWLLGSSLRPEALPLIESLEEPRVLKKETTEPVYESPVFITHLNNVECKEGDNVHFECHVEPSKDPTLGVEWFVNGKPLQTGARFKSTYDFGFVSLDISGAYPEDAGIYTCKAKNNKGEASTSGSLRCTSKQDIYLQTQHPMGEAGLEKVKEADDAYASKLQRQTSKPETEFPKPYFTVPLEPQFNLGEAQPLHLECHVEPKADPNLKVEWYFNGKALEHGSRFKMTCDFGFVTLDLTEVYERDQGIYTCKAVNRQGEAFTSTTIYCTSKTGLIEHTQHPKGAEGLEKIQDLEDSLKKQEPGAAKPEDGGPPKFTSQFQNLSNLSEGEIAHFEASLTPIGDETMVVEWFYKGEVLKASHRIRTVYAFGMVVLEILGTKIEDSGEYTCRATNKWGQDEISVILECVDKSKGQKPQFTTQIQSLEGLKDGQAAHFECTLIPVGDPNMKVEWFHNGKPIRHSSRFKSVSDFGFVFMDISYVQSHDSGEWMCKASNKYGEDYTKATIKCFGKGGVYLDSLQPDSLARIRELELGQGGAPQTPTSPTEEPPKFITHISDITQLVEGQSAHFEARLTPVTDPDLKVEWYYNDKKLPHGHRYRTFHDFGIVILDILYCYEENSGVYECRAVNKYGSDVTRATLKCVSKTNLILDSQLPQGMEGGLEKIQNLEDSLIRSTDRQVMETKGQAPVFTVPLSNIDSLREGESAHFEARLIPTDDPKLKVEWFWNGKPLKAGSRFRTFCDFGFVILEISPVYPEDSGEYSCRAFNDYGEAVTTATMKVQGKRSIILESQLPKGMERTIEKIAELEGLGSAPQAAPEDDTGKPPEFITTPSDLTLTENSLAHFECRLIPINDSSMRVEWFHNGKALSAGSRIKTINDFGFVILEVAGVYQRDSGLYTCKATNRHGEASVSCKLQVRGRQGVVMEPQIPTNFRTATESIQKLEEALYKRDELMSEDEQPNPPRFTVELKDIEAQEGGATHFDCRVEPVGDSTMRIDWFFNGRPFATGSRVHMLNDFGFIVLDMDYVYTRDSGEYVCRATNKWGSATTKATITVKSKHNVILDSQLPSGMSGEKLKELERGPLTSAPTEEAPRMPPKFITQIQSASIGESEPVHFECRVEPKNDVNLRVEWYRNGKLLPCGHRYRTVFDMGFVSLDILYCYAEDNGEYVCRAYNDLGEDKTRATIQCKKLPSIILQNQVPKGMKKSEVLMQMEATIKKYTSEVHLTEEDLYDADKKQPPRFVTQILDQTTLVEMQTTKFECQLAPVGDPNMKVEWFFNGKPLPYKNRFTPIYDFGYVAMNFGWVYPEDSGEYLCRATNLYGMDETRAVIKTAGKPGIIYDSQLPKGMKSIEKIREMEAAWQVVPEDTTDDSQPKTAPAFVTKPEPYSATEGESARFCCRVTGYPRPRVMWIINGHTVVNGMRYKLTYDGMWHLDIPKTRQYDHGKIEVIARNSAGESIATTDLTVKAREDDYRNVLKNSPRRILGTKEYRKPEWVTHMEELQDALRATQCVPTFVQEIKDVRAEETETVVFECQYQGMPVPDIVWYRNDKLISNTKNLKITTKNLKSICTIQHVTVEDEGTYVCKATSQIGETTSRAKLHVRELPEEKKREWEVKKAKEEEERIKAERLRVEMKRLEKRKGTVIFETDTRTTAGVQETQVLESTTQITQTTRRAKAERVISVAESVETSAIASCKKIDDKTEKVQQIEQKAVKIAPVQESVTVVETQPQDTVKQFYQRKFEKKAESKVLTQESVSVSQIQTQSTVKELVEKKPKQRRAKPEKKPEVQETAVVSEVQTKRAEEIMVVENVRMAKEVDETMQTIKAREFGPGESPLRELAKIGFLVRQGITVNEIVTLYQADIFPELRTPQAQSALVQVVERKGYGTLISQVLTEESTTDETEFASTVGFRAFMRMVELNYATVEEVITHFVPEDFSPQAWETSEATQVVTKKTTEKVEVTKRTDVQVQERKKQVKKGQVKTKEEEVTEGVISKLTVPKEQVSPTETTTEKQSLIIKTVQSEIKEESLTTEEVVKAQATENELPKKPVAEKTEPLVKEAPKEVKKTPKKAGEETLVDQTTEVFETVKYTTEEAHSMLVESDAMEVVQVTPKPQELVGAPEPDVKKPVKKVVKKKPKEPESVKVPKVSETEDATPEEFSEEKPEPKKAGETLLLLESVKTEQVITESSVEELQPEKRAPEEAKPIEEEGEDVVQVTQPEVKTSVKKPSKKKKKPVVKEESPEKVEEKEKSPEKIEEAKPELEERKIEEIPEVKEAVINIPDAKPVRPKKMRPLKFIPELVTEQPVLMIVERKAPTKIKMTQVQQPEEKPLFTQVKLRKSSIQKKEIESVKLQKVLLKGRMQVIEYPPEEQKPVITYMTPPVLDRGILSRNAQEAMKVLKKKTRKIKVTDHEETELEEVGFTIEMPEKQVTEEEETKTVWERTPKKPEEETQEPRKLSIGKGKVPEPEQPQPEEIKLKKIPEKPAPVDEEEKLKPKKKEPEETKLRKKVEREKPEVTPFKPFDVEREDIELEKPEKFEPVEPEEKEKEEPKEKKEKPKKPVIEPDTEQIAIVKGVPKKPEPEEEKDIKLHYKVGEPEPEEPTTIKLKPWKKDKPEEEPQPEEITIGRPKPEERKREDEEITLELEKPKEEPIKRRASKKKQKPEEPVPEKPVEEVPKPVEEKPEAKPVEEVEEKVVLKKPVTVKEEEETSESVVLKKPVVKPVVEEVAEEITLKKVVPKEPEEEEVSQAITIKKKRPSLKKVVTEEVTEEVVLKKVTREEPKEEEVSEAITITRKPSVKPVVEEVAEEITIKKVEPQEPQQVEDVAEAFTIKKKRPSIKETVVEDVSEEITLKKFVPTEPKEEEEVTQAITLKKKPKKPVVEEVAEEITIKKEVPEEPEDVTEAITIIKKPEEPKEVTEEVTLKKKKPKKPVVEEVTEEITLKKKIVPQEPTEEEEVSEAIVLKKKPSIKPVVEEEAAEITLKKVMPEKPEDVSEQITLKKKAPKPKVTEDVSEEITITKKKPQEVKTEDVVGEFTIKKKPAPRKYSVEEISEEISIKQPARKPSVPEIQEVTDVATVTLQPKVVKTKEDIEQEFKISLQTYEEEDVSMSGKVRLKKQRPLTFAEETGESTITITQEIEQEGEPIIEEVSEDEEDVVVPLQRKPGYQVEEIEGEETVRMKKQQQYTSETLEESFKVPLRKKSTEVRRTSYSIEEHEEEFQIGLKKERQEAVSYDEESLQLKLKPKRKPTPTMHQEAVSLSITKESQLFEEDIQEAVVTEIREGDMLFSICSYVAENEDALHLVEGERVYILECHNSDWWFVKKHLTEEKGWVPAKFLKDEPSYTLYVQKTLHEKIDKLPVFEKPSASEQVSAPRFIEKLQPKHSPDGGTVQFECQVVGTPRPQITWFRQTAIILPSTDFQIFYDDDNVATLIIREVFPEDAGMFTCVAKNAAGFASSTTELTVEAPLSDHGSDVTVVSRKSLSRESSLADILEGIPPTFSRKPKALCVSEGTDVELECRLVAIPEPEVTWYCQGRELTTSGNITCITESDMHMYCTIVKIKKVKKTQEGSYEIVAKNREGEASVQFTLKVKTGENEPPQILEPLKSAIVREGDSVVLSTQIVGTPKPTITWLRNGQPVAGLPTTSDKDTHTLTLIHPGPDDEGEYSVSAVNPVGKAETTASVIIEALPTLEPPMFVERFQEQHVKNKGTIRLVAKVTGNPTPKIMWLWNNEPLKPSPNITQMFDGENIVLEITNADSEVDAGDYKCVASNPIGKTSHGARVTVDVDKVTFTKPLKRAVAVDEQDSLVLECETSHTVSTRWYHNGKEVSGMDHRELIQEGRIHRLLIKKTKPLDAGVYKCTVKNQTTEATVTVRATKAVFVRKLQDFEVKERECAILEVEISSETADVTWHKDGEQLPEGGEKFVFEKRGHVRKLLIRNASVHEEGEYTCALGEQECTAEVIVVELPPEIITTMQDVTIARGEKAMFEIELTKGDALVRWFKDGKELQFSEHVQLSIDGKRQKLKVYNSLREDSGEYSCVVGEQTSKARLTVEEPAVDFITRLPDVTLIPLNKDASFMVELSRPEVEVQWLRKGKPIKPSDRHIITSDGSVRKLVIKKVTLEDQTDYTCVAVNIKTSSKLKVEIIETAPKINLDLTKREYRVKKGEDVTIEVKYSSTPRPKDEWFVNGKVVQKSKRITQTLTEESASLTIKKVEESDVGNYTIKLSNNCGEASAELTLIMMQPPSQPGTPDVVEVTNDSITLHWKEPESDGNSPIINYILEYHDRKEISFNKVNANFNITETTYKMTEMQHNAEYMFKVTAVNEVGPSIPSHNTRYVKIAAPQKAEPATIQEPLKDTISRLKQTVTLSCVIGGVPEPDIKWLRDGRVFKSKTMSYENRVAKYVINETTEASGGTYTCQVKNEAGSAETTCTLKIQEPPTIDVDETLVTQKLRITSQWKIQLNISGFPMPSLTWTKDGKDLTSTKHCSIYIDDNSSTIAIYSLEKQDTGKYVLMAQNEAGSATAELNLRVIDDSERRSRAQTPTDEVIDKPSKPEGPINVKEVKSESVIIEWKPPADDGGLELSKYSVEKCEIEKMVWCKVADVEKDVSSYCVQQLREDAEYLFRVIAENPIGSSEALESDPVTVRSKFDKPSPPRGPLDVSGMTQTSFTITWQQSERDGGCPIIEYIIERREVGKKAWQKVGSTRADDTHIIVQDLKVNTSYHFRITARNEVGTSAPFAPEDPIIAGKRISSPSAPTNLNLTDITSKSVTLQWGPPTSTGGTELTGYIVEKRLSTEEKWVKVVTLDPSVTQHLIENLREKSEYFFRVYAENSIGLSPPAGTDLVSLKTHATPPSPPTAPLEIRAIGPNSVIIEWGIPESDGGAPIEGYTIAIRDTKKTMWMEVGRVKADIQKLTIKDLQENHEYLIRIFARNEVGPSEPLESDEPFQMLRPDVMEPMEVENADITTAPTLSFSTETTTSWMKEANMDADIRSYARGSLLRRDEYFFRIWYYARQLFK